MSDPIHFYEPRDGHRLPHDPFNAIVGPRPIGWISSRSAAGTIVGFASIGYKDTVRNIEQTGEFAWNLVTRPLAEAMNQTCAPVPAGVSEFELAGLTPLASRIIAVPRVAESPVSFECRCTQIVQLQAAGGEPVPTWLVLGEVVGVHIDRSMLEDGVYDTGRAGHVLRGGGPADYFSIEPAQLFHMFRPR
jgi:flavin reductase (DIM6/NTAB) family NADH-FMN oxidoreductase RutF